MMDEMANHKTRVSRANRPSRPGQGRDFIDACLSLDTLIDYHAPAIQAPSARRVESDERAAVQSHEAREPVSGELRQPRGVPGGTAQGSRRQAARQKHFPGASGARRAPLPARERAARATGSATCSPSSARRRTTSHRRARRR